MMTFSSKFVRRGATGAVVACAIAGFVGGFAVPTANAAPCTASGLAAAAGPVFSEVGTYLDAHPGANDVLTAAASQSPDDARSSVTGYFTGHVGEFLALQSMTKPLSDLRAQCGVSISPNQFLSLYETLSSASIG
jgi:heme-binding protein